MYEDRVASNDITFLKFMNTDQIVSKFPVEYDINKLLFLYEVYEET
jgi:hypothetical protein